MVVVVILDAGESIKWRRIARPYARVFPVRNGVNPGSSKHSHPIRFTREEGREAHVLMRDSDTIIGASVCEIGRRARSADFLHMYQQVAFLTI